MPAFDPAPVLRHVIAEAAAKLRKCESIEECADLDRKIDDANRGGDYSRALTLLAKRSYVAMLADVTLLEMQTDLDADSVTRPRLTNGPDVDAMRAALLARIPAALTSTLCAETPARAVEVALAGGRCAWPWLGDRGLLDLWSFALMSPCGLEMLEMDAALLGGFLSRRGGVE